jgi:hypothetical protein
LGPKCSIWRDYTVNAGDSAVSRTTQLAEILDEDDRRSTDRTAERPDEAVVGVYRPSFAACPARSIKHVGLKQIGLGVFRSEVL